MDLLLDSPRILTLTMALAGALDLIFRRRKLPRDMRWVFVVFLLHDAAFYIAYFATHRFQDISHVPMVLAWPQILRFHGVITAMVVTWSYEWNYLRASGRTSLQV